MAQMVTLKFKADGNLSFWHDPKGDWKDGDEREIPISEAVGMLKNHEANFKVVDGPSRAEILASADALKVSGKSNGDGAGGETAAVVGDAVRTILKEANADAEDTRAKALTQAEEITAKANEEAAAVIEKAKAGAPDAPTGGGQRKKS